MRLCEEFISIQGEGRESGQLSYFVRLAGCNLKCSFCDEPNHTDNTKYYEVSVDGLVSKIRESKVFNVIITGGEPTLQSEVSLLIRKLRELESVSVSIETNGYDLDKLIEADLITWSPKYNFEEAFLKGEEVKGFKKPECVVGGNLDIKLPWPSSVPEDRLLEYIEFLGSQISIVANTKVWLTPINNALQVSLENTKSAWELVYKHRKVSVGDFEVQLNLNTQVHKFLNLR